MNRQEMAMICKALSDSNRLEILEMIKYGEKCACHILEHLQISQSTLSYHMKLLSDAGIVTIRKDGKWSHYSIDPKGCKKAEAYIFSLYEGNQKTNKCTCQ